MTKKKMEPPKRLNMSLEEIILEDKKQKRNHVQRPIVRKRHSSESSEQPSFSVRKLPIARGAPNSSLTALLVESKPKRGLVNGSF